MERRGQVRAAQLEEGRRMEKRRAERLAALEAKREGDRSELIETHTEREERVHHNLDSRWQDRSVVIEKKIEKAQSPPREFRPLIRSEPSYLRSLHRDDQEDGGGNSPSLLRGSPMGSPRRAVSVADTAAYSTRSTARPDEDLTSRRIDHARSNLAKQRQELDEARATAAIDRSTRDALMAAAQSIDYQRRLAKHAGTAARRLDIRASAAEREEARQQKVDADAAKRAAHAEKQLAALSQARSARVASDNAEHNQRLLACLEEVNVKRHENLVNDMQRKQQKRDKFVAAQEAARAVEAERREREQREHARVQAQREHARAAAREREAEERRQAFKRKVDCAAAAKDAALRDQAARLRATSCERTQAVQRTEAAREVERAQLAESLEMADRKRAEAIEARARDAASERAAVAREKERLAQTALSKHYELYDEKRERAHAKLEQVTVRAHSSLDIRREKLATLASVARAHASTPAPELPALLLSHSRHRLPHHH